MSKACSTCGQSYPDNFRTCTCRYCGGLIEDSWNDLSPKEFAWLEQWHAWQELYSAAAPKVLKESDWLKICGYFNSCSICGSCMIEEKLLVIPPFLGGHLYVYNVLPACETCAKRVRQSQVLNPIKSLYSIQGANKDLVTKGLRYLEALIVGKEPVDFDFDEDTLEIIIACPEDTSILPFSGIYAKRIFKQAKRGIATSFIADRQEEYEGITWRLI